MRFLLILGNGPSLEIAGFCITFSIFNTADKRTCSFSCFINDSFMTRVFQPCNSSYNSRGVSRINKRGPSTLFELLLLTPFSLHSLPSPSLPSVTSPSISFPSPSLRSRLPLIQLCGLGSTVSSPGGLGGDGRQTLFGAFWTENASGKSFWYIHENSSTKSTSLLVIKMPIFFSHQGGPGDSPPPP